MPSLLRKIVFVALTVLLLFAVAEGVLRMVFAVQGYSVGSLAPNWFPPVAADSPPILQPSYFTDSTGLFKANQAYWAERGVKVNEHGFLGNDWPTGSEKTRLLLIGDSFVWGAGADELRESFAAILAQEPGFEVLNAGIPGADPAQYQLIAERFVPQVQPQVVVLCLYMGNDVVAHHREPLPHQALYYPSDVGWFPGYHQGQYFGSLEASYQYYLQQYAPPNPLARNTAVGTAMYSLPLRLKERKERKALAQSSITNYHLKAIKATCEQYGAQLVIIPIPFSGTDLVKEYQADSTYLQSLYPNVFTGLEEELCFLAFNKDHFHPLPDGHFNNQGHRYFAAHAQQILARYLNMSTLLEH